MRKVSKKCIDLIKSFEGFKTKPYLDPVKIPTIGYGTIEYADGRKVTMNDASVTEEKATEMLEHEVNKKAKSVESLVKVQINQNQFDALVCFAYNIGVGGLKDSTLLKMLNSGNYSGAADQFLRWNKAGGKELPGLTRRRQAERSLFLQTDISEKSSSDMLSQGPSDEEIAKKLADIEKDILKK